MSKKKRVLLLGWDAADWQHINPLLDQGLMPNLERLIDNGVMGNLATMQPIFSPMLWNTIATGKLPDEHGILGFMEPDPSGKGMRPVTSLSRKTKAIWNILNQEGYRSNVVGWWAGHPAEPINGRIVTPNIKHAKKTREGMVSIPPGTVHPQSFESQVARCRVFAEELDGNDVGPFIPLVGSIDPAEQPALGSFMEMLAECATIQATAVEAMKTADWDFSAIYFDSIDHFCHRFMKYQAPKMYNISDQEFEFYQHVITGVYQFHDMILEVLWKLAGEDALVIVCSDHGFLSGDSRPIAVSNEPGGPADWHREFGMIAMAGPGIKKDERIYGANLIDVTPTILSYLDLPIGEDMKGKPLLSAFEDPVKVKTIPSWEDREGDSGMHPPGTELEVQQSDDLRKQFVALGYVDDYGDDLEKANRGAQIELDYNLARVYIGTNRPDLARPIFEQLLADDPWEERFIIRLSHCYFMCGYYRQCINLIEQANPDNRMPPNLQLLRARSLAGLGDYEKANEEFALLLKRKAQTPQLHLQLGRVFLSQRQPAKAIEAFRQSLSLDPEFAFAYAGLAKAYLRQRNFESSAESALDALRLIHHLPGAHYTLGVAFARLGEYERAALAFENCIHLNPALRNAHRWLSRLYSRFLEDADRAHEHNRKYLESIDVVKSERLEKKNRAKQLFPIPDIPNVKTRRETLMQERPGTHNRKPTGRTLVLVSGLPRSGTSLMMQMLQAGGLDPMTDGERKADIDNPEGYLEWETIKKLPTQPQILDDPLLDDRATKVISMLLHHLPKIHRYKIIFMLRPIEEIVLSQAKMLQRLGTEGSQQSDEETAALLDSHRTNILELLNKQQHIELLTVGFRDLVDDADQHVNRIVEFLGEDRLPNPDQMKAVIKPELHRQKK